jgi:Tol biopolymer transport system component
MRRPALGIVLVWLALLACGTLVERSAGAQDGVPGANGRIAFVVQRYPQSIWTVDADGTGARRIVVNALGAAWSPDGTKLAFDRFVTRLPQAGVERIFVVGADGTKQRKLADGFDPAWSPDGRQIAYTCRPPGPPSNAWAWAVCVINADGTGATTLTTRDDPARRPVWSPDGTRIAYLCFEASSSDLCVMRRDGTGRVRLTKTSGKISEEPLDWSAKDDRILFERVENIGFVGNNDTPSYTYRLAVIRPNGSGLRNLPLATGACCGHWSPDGTSMVFGRDGAIWVGDAEGAHARQIAEGTPVSWRVGLSDR